MSDSAGKLPVLSGGDDWCPLTATALLIGKKWHPVIIHRLVERNALGFNALQSEVDGISSKVLSDSLDDLEEKRLVHREIVSEKPVRVEYTLTDRGRSLAPVIDAMLDWGAEHLEPTPDPEASVV